MRPRRTTRAGNRLQALGAAGSVLGAALALLVDETWAYATAMVVVSICMVPVVIRLFTD